jgi:hypothetical protein
LDITKAKSPGINPELFTFTVALVRVQWNQIMEELRQWQQLKVDTKLALMA